MTIPRHSPNCHTTTWSTSCPSCRAKVFFFSCGCGSRVFFDALGDPWPKHADSCTKKPPPPPPIAKYTPPAGPKLPVLTVSPEGDTRQIAGFITRLLERKDGLIELSLQDEPEDMTLNPIELDCLVEPKIYRALGLTRGMRMWALLRPYPGSRMWLADEVCLY